MEHKAVDTIALKDDGGNHGSAIFSRFGGPPDSDGDITEPTAFRDGEQVPMSSYGHGSWGGGQLPVGLGTVRVKQDRAEFFFRVFDTEAGRDTRIVLRELGPIQQWSFGYEVEDSEPGTWQGQPVRILKRLKVFEVSPVLLGAGRDTMTASMKRRSELTPAEHAIIAASWREVQAFQAEQAAADAAASAYLRDLAAKLAAADNARACERIVDGATYQGSETVVVDSARVPTKTRLAAEHTAALAAAQLHIPVPDVRWFEQPGALTLWGRALPGKGTIFVNMHAGPREAVATSAHETAHMAGRDEDGARRFEADFLKEITR